MSRWHPDSDVESDSKHGDLSDGPTKETQGTELEVGCRNRMSVVVPVLTCAMSTDFRSGGTTHTSSVQDSSLKETQGTGRDRVSSG